MIEKRLTQGQAAAQLGLSLRQVERLCRAMRQLGAFGLVLHKRGRPEDITRATARLGQTFAESQLGTHFTSMVTLSILPVNANGGS